MGTVKPTWNDGVNEWLRQPELDILQSSSDLAFHWVEDIKLESVISVWELLFAFKFTHNQLVIYHIYATAVFGSEGQAFTYLSQHTFMAARTIDNCGKHHSSGIFFFLENLKIIKKITEKKQKFSLFCTFPQCATVYEAIILKKKLD